VATIFRRGSFDLSKDDSVLGKDLTPGDLHRIRRDAAIRTAMRRELIVAPQVRPLVKRHSDMEIDVPKAKPLGVYQSEPTILDLSKSNKAALVAKEVEKKRQPQSKKLMGSERLHVTFSVPAAEEIKESNRDTKEKEGEGGSEIPPQEEDAHKDLSNVSDVEAPPVQSPPPEVPASEPYPELKQFLSEAKCDDLYDTFVQEHITTLEVLKLLNERNLKELGLPMGERLKILKKIQRPQPQLQPQPEKCCLM